jgi:hypothetical protein
MTFTLSRIAWAVTIVWLAFVSVIAGRNWEHRSAERDGLYEQCLRETPNVEECRSLRASTEGEDIGDVARDFAIMAIVPGALLWGSIWFVRRRRGSGG